MIEQGKDGYRALCQTCGYIGKWKAKRGEAVVAMDQHEHSQKHRRHLRQERVRPAA